MRTYLEKNNEHGEIVKITYSMGGYIWSDSWSPKHGNDAVSETGMHMGVAYKGKIYCNIHPEGRLEQEWFNDFYGLGVRDIHRDPF